MSFAIAYAASKCDYMAHEPKYWVSFIIADVIGAVALIIIGALLKSYPSLSAGFGITGGAILLLMSITTIVMGIQKIKDVCSGGFLTYV